MTNIQTTLEKELKCILAHPFIDNLSCGKFTKRELKLFAEQYYLVSSAFIQFLLLGSTNIKEDADRSAFIENLFDEHGRGNSKVNHRDLLKRFLLALGCNDIDSITPLEKTSVYIHGMRDLCTNGSQLEVLGALGPGCEAFTVEQYTLIHDAIKQHFDFAKEELVFFASHIAHDPSHTNEIDEVIDNLVKNKEDSQEVLSGAKKSMILESILWDGIYEECNKLKEMPNRVAE